MKKRSQKWSDQFIERILITTTPKETNERNQGIAEILVDIWMKPSTLNVSSIEPTIAPDERADEVA